MTRLLKLMIVFVSIVSLASAQVVDTFNTPPGPITQGATVILTWSFLPSVNPDTVNSTGALNAVETATKNTTVIEQAVPLKPKSYSWVVSIEPGTYNLGLNDGSGIKQTAEVEIVAKGANPPSTSPSTSGSSSPSGGSEPSPAKSPETPASKPTTGSASSIFSGYGVVFSLLAVAIAMVQF